VSALGWRLRRLQAMSPAEIAGRVQVAARDRLLPPSYTRWSPEQAAEHLFGGDPAEALETNRMIGRFQVPSDASAYADTVGAAWSLSGGRWEVFGRPVLLADPPAWSHNPFTGASWPDAPSRAIDYRRTDLAGGVKPVWEIGRLTMLPTLALAACVSGESAHADRAARWLRDFTRANPLGHGIHHTSGIEMAIRVITATATLALLPPAARAGMTPTLGLIAQQALHCRDHLSLGSSANNHLIAEYAAMTVLGASFPTLRNGRRLMMQGHAGLVRETLRQILPDGGTAEQAFGYLPFVWELLLIAFCLADDAGVQTPQAARDRLAASLEFGRALRLPDGSLPHIGDEDDGRVLLGDETESRVDVVGDALASWLGREGLGGRHAPLARLLTGRAPTARRAPDGRASFPHAGYTVWRHGGQMVTFDHGPLGFGALAAHGHADALSLTIHHLQDPIVIDPGTLAYQEDAVARDRCRSTPVHSTVNFGGRSQSQMLGPFLWGDRARVEGQCCVWTSGERHTREVQVESGRIQVDDHAEGHDPELVYALPPGADVRLDGAMAHLVSGASMARLDLTGGTAWRLEPAESARRFALREPSARLVARIGERCRTIITLGPR
jgi:hypothetical protein